MIFSQPGDPLLSSALTLLAYARADGASINRTKLAKLLYLADLAAVESGATPFTGATWRWDNYGPFDSALYRIETTLLDSGIIERESGLSDGVVLRLIVDVDAPLPRAESTYIDQVMAKHGSKSASSLRALSYETPPMQEAQAGGERGVVLDLNRARRAKQFQQLKERFRRQSTGQPQQKRDPKVEAALREEHAEMQLLRKRANAKILGG